MKDYRIISVRKRLCIELTKANARAAEYIWIEYKIYSGWASFISYKCKQNSNVVLHNQQISRTAGNTSLRLIIMYNMTEKAKIKSAGMNSA